MRGLEMKKDPLVSIIILNWNGLEHLKSSLPSVVKTNYSNYEITLVDNGSTDRSVDFVRKNFPNIKIVRNERNLGAPSGFNLGILHAKGKYIALLNNDIEVDADWLQPLIKVMEEFPDVAAVDPKYLNYYERNRFDTSAAAGRYIDFTGNPICVGLDEEDKGQYDEIRRIFTCCTLFRREIFNEVGLFDQDFFYGYDDVDLSWRINLRGYRILYVPFSRIYHKISLGYCYASNGKERSARTRKFRRGLYFLNKRNKLLIILKNYSSKTLFWVLPLVLFEHLGYIIYWSVKRDKQYSFESFKAILWVLKNFKKIWVKHNLVQSIRKLNDREILKIMKPYRGDPIIFLSSLLKPWFCY